MFLLMFPVVLRCSTENLSGDENLRNLNIKGWKIFSIKGGNIIKKNIDFGYYQKIVIVQKRVEVY